MERGERLFAKHDFGSAVRNAPSRLIEAIEKITDSQLFDRDERKVIDELVTAFVIVVPVLNVDAIKPSEREVQIDVSGDQRRFIPDRSRPFYMTATEVSFKVPYVGDPELFRCVPASVYPVNMPHAEIGSDSIIIRVVRQDQNAAEYRKEFDRIISQIQGYLDQLRSDCAGLETTLRETAAGHLPKRREKRQKDRGLIEGLGFGKTKG